MKLLAGIILYNPNIEHLKLSISELSIPSEICLIDNGSKNIEEIRKLKNKKVKLIENSTNFGIAKALNQLLDYAQLNNFSNLLTLDQDSILKNEMLKNMTNYINKENVALICPLINDLNKNKRIVQNENVVEVKRCITSGTIMNLKECKKIGKFDEKMFIDYVDFDYCKRVLLNNKKIIRLKNAVIDHEVGKRSSRKFLFINVYPTNHNPKRIYFYARNIKYYMQKFSKEMSLIEKIVEYKYLSWKLISIILYEKNKREKIIMFYKGIRDSKKM